MSNLTSPSGHSINSPWWMAFVFAGGCLLLGMLAAYWGFTFGSDWEDRLVKPSIWPPIWFFGVAWGILYPLIGTATWLVWRRRYEVGVGRALVLFAVHLIVLLSWLPVVHSAKNALIPALMDMLGGVSAFAMTWTYSRLSKAAMWLLMPYLGWTCFTTFIKFWRLALNLS